jgi:hypothetical protein
VKQLQEHQKHIADEKAGMGRTLCGETEYGFMLTGFPHAVNCILSGDFTLPCPDCWAKVLTFATYNPMRFKSEERVR